MWDDSALIKAYDKAINLAKEEVGKRMGIGIKNSECKQKLQKQSKLTSKPYKVMILL